MTLDLRQLCFIDLVSRVLAHRFERTHDGQVVAMVVTGLDRAAVNKDGWNVQTRDRDHRTRHVLVAAADGEHTVHALAVAHGFD